MPLWLLKVVGIDQGSGPIRTVGISGGGSSPSTARFLRVRFLRFLPLEHFNTTLIFESSGMRQIEQVVEEGGNISRQHAIHNHQLVVIYCRLTKLELSTFWTTCIPSSKSRWRLTARPSFQNSKA